MATRPANASARSTADIALLERLEERLRWLSAWTIHHANHLRPADDGVKVGGHQASCASMAAIMAALYGQVLGPHDRVAVKPHGGPLLHALHYLAGTQSAEALRRFRGFGGAQSYPSRTKDQIPVDFSTGSVGLGVALTGFASLVEDWLVAHGARAADERGRMVALVGDAELDEGNIYEAAIDYWKHGVERLWWVVDYNRQSLDQTTPDRMFSRFDDMFETLGWRVITLRHGRLQREAFAESGGRALEAWIEACPNADYAALSFQGGPAWRSRLEADLAGDRRALALIARRSDAELAQLMTNLGGHCLETLVRAFEQASGPANTLFLAYTVKGYGLPFQGHKDNHAGLMTPAQVDALRMRLGIPKGAEWDRWAGLGQNEARALEALMAARPWATRRDSQAKAVAVPRLRAPTGEVQSTQQAFGRILVDLARSGGPLADRILTTSPDVTVSTNLGGFVNQRGLFRRSATPDVFRLSGIASPQKWSGHPAGQHVELGIAEHNLFLMLAAAGLSGPLFGERLFPIGTVYDPFIARGLDALNYGCYQGARFLLVATPSGLTLGPEGGAHQSINPPLLAMGQPGLTHYEPAFADEVALFMERAFRAIAAEEDGEESEATYLRLSTRPIQQPARQGEDWQADALAGGYWLIPPQRCGPLALVAMGALMPEALEAHAMLAEDLPGLGLLQITSPDLLHRGWRRDGAGAHAAKLLSALEPGAGLVTLCDAAPATLSWLGAVDGRRVQPLGVDRFGQTGSLAELYRAYGLDAEAVVAAAARLLA